MLEFSFLPTTESRELVDDLRQVFADLAATPGPPAAGATRANTTPRSTSWKHRTPSRSSWTWRACLGEAVRVLFRGDVLIVAGEKAPPPTTSEPNFHLLERGYGRFARAVRLSGAFEIGQAEARLSSGELTIILPKRVDRRGQVQKIPIQGDTRQPA